MVLLDPNEDSFDILRANRSREKQYVFDQTFDCSATQTDVYESTTWGVISSVVSGYNATVFAYGATGRSHSYNYILFNVSDGHAYRVSCLLPSHPVPIDHGAHITPIVLHNIVFPTMLTGMN